MLSPGDEDGEKFVNVQNVQHSEVALKTELLQKMMGKKRNGVGESGYNRISEKAVPNSLPR